MEWKAVRNKGGPQTGARFNTRTRNWKVGQKDDTNEKKRRKALSLDTNDSQ